MVKTLSPEHKEKLRLGREKARQSRVTQKEIVETIKEVIKYIPEPRLEGWELYKALRDAGFYQGGIGQTMENVNGTDRAYIPEVSEIYGAFVLDPQGWGNVRDALCREWIEVRRTYGL